MFRPVLLAALIVVAAAPAARAQVASDDSATSYIETMTRALETGDNDTAVRVGAEAVKTLPDNATLAYLYAAALAATNRVEEALPHARRATELAPDDGFAWYQRGALAYRLGGREEARAALERADELAGGDDPDVRDLLAALDGRDAHEPGAGDELPPQQQALLDELTRQTDEHDDDELTPFELGFRIGLIVGIPIAIFVAIKLFRR